MIRKKIIVLFIAIILSFALGNLTKRSIINGKGKSNIKFYNNLYDFGKIKNNHPVSTYFKYTNVSDNELIITDIITDCGCTSGKINEKTIRKAEQDSILISFDSSTKGAFSREIFIISNSITSPDPLHIRGYVE